MPFNHSLLIVVGDGRAGKTALINSLRGKDFDPHTTSTVGIDQHDADITFANNANISVTNVSNLGAWKDHDIHDHKMEAAIAHQVAKIQRGLTVP